MKLSSHSRSVRTVAFSPDGLVLGSGSDDCTIKLWDTATGQEMHELAGHKKSVTAIAFSPDGVLLASASEDHTLRLWNVATGQELKRLTNTNVTTLSFSAVDSRLTYVSSNGRICLWDSATGEETELRGLPTDIQAVVLSQDSSLLVFLNSSGSLRAFNLTNRTEKMKFAGLLPHKDRYSSQHLLAVCEETSQLIHANGTDICLFNLENGQIIWEITTGHYPDIVHTVTFYQHGTRLACGLLSGSIIVWDTATGQKFQTLSGHIGPVESLAVSPDGLRVAAGSYNGTITVWDLTTGHAVQEAEVNKFSVRGMTSSQDGTVVVSQSSDSMIRLWNPKTGQCFLQFKAEASGSIDPVFSPDGSLLALALKDGTIGLWSGSSLAPAAAGETIEMWNTTQVRELWKLRAGYTTSVIFSQNGLSLASRGGGSIITVWNTTTGLQVQILETHIQTLMEVALSPDASRLACVSSDGIVTLWNLKTSQKIPQLKRHSPQWITAVAFSPDESLVAFASIPDTINLWDLVTDQVRIFRAMDWISSISITVDKKTIITNRGEISFQPKTIMSASLDPCSRRTTIIENGWIQCNGRNYLWLPEEYREARMIYFRGGMFSFGLASGQVAFIKIQNQGD